MTDKRLTTNDTTIPSFSRTMISVSFGITATKWTPDSVDRTDITFFIETVLAEVWTDGKD